jgi:cell fate (sporulation/competence/biofilm development) regulator YlbF (YheA/YmcA/DUF963 family)
MSTETAAGMDVEDELGSDLGRAIADLPEYERFVEAKRAVERSEAAQEKVQAFERTREEFMLARQTGDATQENLRDLQRAQEGLHEVPAMAEYLDAQNDLEARLERINEAISAGLAIDFGEHVGACCQD